MTAIRPDFLRIADWIGEGARVLDLGCEDGALLSHLRAHRRVDGIGVDIDNNGMIDCLANDIPVIHSDIREDLSLFAPQSFDYVILSQTLQSLDRPPREIIREMLRVGRVAIVSVPNFGYWLYRLQLLAGRMPMGGALPYSWHNTPNLRYCTIADFERWCLEEGFSIDNCVHIGKTDRITAMPNLRATMAIFQLTVPANGGGGKV